MLIPAWPYLQSEKLQALLLCHVNEMDAGVARKFLDIHARFLTLGLFDQTWEMYEPILLASELGRRWVRRLASDMARYATAIETNRLRDLRLRVFRRYIHLADLHTAQLKKAEFTNSLANLDRIRRLKI